MYKTEWKIKSDKHITRSRRDALALGIPCALDVYRKESGVKKEGHQTPFTRYYTVCIR